MRHFIKRKICKFSIDDACVSMALLQSKTRSHHKHRGRAVHSQRTRVSIEKGGAQNGNLSSHWQQSGWCQELRKLYRDLAQTQSSTIVMYIQIGTYTQSAHLFCIYSLLMSNEHTQRNHTAHHIRVPRHQALNLFCQMWISIWTHTWHIAIFNIFNEMIKCWTALPACIQEQSFRHPICCYCVTVVADVTFDRFFTDSASVSSIPEIGQRILLTVLYDGRKKIRIRVGNLLCRLWSYVGKYCDICQWGLAFFVHTSGTAFLFWWVSEWTKIELAGVASKATESKLRGAGKNFNHWYWSWLDMNGNVNCWHRTES